MGSNREESNIAIAILENLTFLIGYQKKNLIMGAPIFSSPDPTLIFYRSSAYSLYLHVHIL